MAKYAMPELEILPIHEKCNGCLKADDLTCSIYANPSAQWRFGFCPMATHLIAIAPSTETKRKRRPGQQKQLKRKASGKNYGRK